MISFTGYLRAEFIEAGGGRIELHVNTSPTTLVFLDYRPTGTVVLSGPPAPPPPPPPPPGFPPGPSGGSGGSGDAGDGSGDGSGEGGGDRGSGGGVGGGDVGGSGRGGNVSYSPFRVFHAVASDDERRQEQQQQQHQPDDRSVGRPNCGATVRHIAEVSSLLKFESLYSMLVSNESVYKEKEIK